MIIYYWFVLFQNKFHLFISYLFVAFVKCVQCVVLVLLPKNVTFSYLSNASFLVRCRTSSLRSPFK